VSDGYQECQEASALTFMMRLSEAADTLPRLRLPGAKITEIQRITPMARDKVKDSFLLAGWLLNSFCPETAEILNNHVPGAGALNAKAKNAATARKANAAT
jgi:hypothetical protein